MLLPVQADSGAMKLLSMCSLQCCEGLVEQLTYIFVVLGGVGLKFTSEISRDIEIKGAVLRGSALTWFAADFGVPRSRLTDLSGFVMLLLVASRTSQGY